MDSRIAEEARGFTGVKYQEGIFLDERIASVVSGGKKEIGGNRVASYGLVSGACAEYVVAISESGNILKAYPFLPGEPAPRGTQGYGDATAVTQGAAKHKKWAVGICAALCFVMVVVCGVIWSYLASIE